MKYPHIQSIPHIIRVLSYFDACLSLVNILSGISVCAYSNMAFVEQFRLISNDGRPARFRGQLEKFAVNLTSLHIRHGWVGVVIQVCFMCDIWFTAPIQYSERQYTPLRRLRLF